MSYPRDYAVHNKEVNIGTAFVIMPIKPEFDMTLGLITEVCEELEILTQRADDISKQDFIMSNILEGITKSEIVIVDITGSNPNVFYELGIAHSLRAKHCVIIITQESDIPKTTPFDIRHWSILQYSYNNKPLFRALLKKRINESRKFINCEEFMTRLLRSYTFEKELTRLLY